MGTTAWPIRWGDTKLTPHVLRHIPDGYRHITQRREAYALGNTAFDILPPTSARHFLALWNSSITNGFLPNGLLLVCLEALPRPKGHITSITARQFSAFCQRQQLWQRVPGKLYPTTHSGVPGNKLRAYLITAPLPNQEAHQ